MAKHIQYDEWFKHNEQNQEKTNPTTPYSNSASRKTSSRKKREKSKIACLPKSTSIGYISSTDDEKLQSSLCRQHESSNSLTKHKSINKQSDVHTKLPEMQSHSSVLHYPIQFTVQLIHDDFEILKMENALQNMQSQSISCQLNKASKLIEPASKSDSGFALATFDNQVSIEYDLESGQVWMLGINGKAEKLISEEYHQQTSQCPVYTAAFSLRILHLLQSICETGLHLEARRLRDEVFGKSTPPLSATLPKLYVPPKAVNFDDLEQPKKSIPKASIVPVRIDPPHATEVQQVPHVPNAVLKGIGMAKQFENGSVLVQFEDHTTITVEPHGCSMVYSDPSSGNKSVVEFSSPKCSDVIWSKINQLPQFYSALKTVIQ